MIAAQRNDDRATVRDLEGSDYRFFVDGRDRWPRCDPDPPWSFLLPEQSGALVDALLAQDFIYLRLAC